MVLFSGFFLIPASLSGQATLRIGAVPSDQYRAAIRVFDDGNFEEALDIYQRELRGSVKFGQKSWIDVICYYTMIGECYFQMGNYAAAFENYDSAMRYYITFNDWLKFVDFDKTAGGGISDVPRGPTPWGSSARNNPMVRFPRSFKIELQFEFLGTGVTASGQTEAGIGVRTEYHTVYAVELVEAMALAIRRRGEILGPLGKHDKLNDALVDIFQQRPYQPNHWSGAWIDLCYGLALAVQGKDDEAHPLLDRSLLIMGTTDHPLTATGFLALGQIAVRAGDFKAAYDRFYEATIAAYYYGNSIVLEEAFRNLAMAQKMIDSRKPCPILIPALEWADREKFTFLRFSLNMLIADDLLILQDYPRMNQFLIQAWNASNRRALRSGRLSGFWNYLSAIHSYAMGKIDEGDVKLLAAMNNTKYSSLWINQIKILEELYRSGQITTNGPLTPRTAMELYGYLLRDPTAQDWSMNPLEALTVVSTPHSDSFERWFFLAIDREDAEKAFEIAELTRRHRFQSTLPFGSRLISLRLLLEAEDRFIPQEFKLDRSEMFVEIPGFKELSEKSRELRRKFTSLSFTPTGNQEIKDLKAAAAEWKQVTQTQEGLLRRIAMSRIRSPNIFPPFKTFRQFREELPDGTVVLMFFESNGEYYGFLIGKEQFDFWRIPNPGRLRDHTAAYLRSLGLLDANRSQSPKDLTKNDWKKPAQQIFTEILAGERQTDYKELVIVPDGFLWYLPFETLQVEVKPGQLRPLIGIIGPNKEEPTLRYAPTAALALPAKTTGHLGAETTVFLGKMMPGVKTDFAGEAFERMKGDFQNLSSLRMDQILVPPPLMAKGMRHLLVLDEISATKAGPYDWTPIPALKPFSADAALGSWLSLPWGCPGVLVFPGFHTFAEDAFKKGCNGDEIFFALTALQSCGADTVLLSRWRTGGRTAYDFSTEFLRNLPKYPTSLAWRKTVFRIAGQTVNFDEEPRVKVSTPEEKKSPIKANHPFFWGAYLLCDRGEIPVKEEKPELTEMPEIDILDLDKIGDPENGDEPDETKIDTENEGDTEEKAKPSDLDVEQLLNEMPEIEMTPESKAAQEDVPEEDSAEKIQ
jgi:tetratricopeptide (TPR) repeat protein